LSVTSTLSYKTDEITAVRFKAVHQLQQWDTAATIEYCNNLHHAQEILHQRNIPSNVLKRP
jgi:hypothetical protein